MKTYSGNYGFVSLLFFLLSCMGFIILGNTILNGFEIAMYPTPDFTKVEKICNELCSDLAVLNFNQQLHVDWVENSDYLFNQFFLLNSAIKNLVNNTEESRSYLLEDIHYLSESIEKVIASYNNVYGSTMQHPLCQFIHKLLQESKEKLQQLSLLNQEIIIA